MTQPVQPTADQQNALDIINQTLAQYGLSSLSGWAWQQIIQGSSPSQVTLQLYQRPEFKAAFPEIALREQNGLPAISPADIINYRNQAQQAMRQAGLPQGFWDQPADFTNLIANNVSLNELQHRIDLAQQATYQVPKEVRDVLARDYGLNDGHLTAGFLDPTRAEPLLQRDFLAAQIGGTAAITGYQTNQAQNERLADMGITQAQAQQGFNQLANSKELMASLPGENTTGISQDDQLAAVFGGNAAAQQELTRRADERKNVFAAGGGFSSGQGGFSGVGSAQGA